MAMLDLRKKALTPEITELFSVSSGGTAKPSELWKAWNDYTTGINFRLWGANEGGITIAIIGLELTTDGLCHLRHAAVAPDRRRQGVARSLFAQATAKFSNHAMRAETTDTAAIAFLTALGFAPVTLTTKYPPSSKVVYEKRVGA